MRYNTLRACPKYNFRMRFFSIHPNNRIELLTNIQLSIWQFLKLIKNFKYKIKSFIYFSVIIITISSFNF